MLGMGVPEWIAKGYVELSEGFSENFANRATDNVATLTGHPARSFEQFARDFAPVFGNGTSYLSSSLFGKPRFCSGGSIDLQSI
jgi:hypothetical protein